MTNETTDYASEIVLDEQYEDKITGVRGTATQLCFDRDGTQQVYLEWGADGEAKGKWLDVDRVLS
jgi:hypothetical protein